MIENMIDSDVSKYLGNITNGLRSFRPLPRTGELIAGKNSWFKLRYFSHNFIEKYKLCERPLVFICSVIVVCYFTYSNHNISSETRCSLLCFQV